MTGAVLEALAQEWEDGKMQLPLQSTWQLLQTKWKSILDSFVSNPSLNSNILMAQSLVEGSNTINHGLGRKLIGWRMIRVRSSATFYDTQDSNPRPQLTLLLTSSEAVVVDLEVF